MQPSMQLIALAGLDAMSYVGAGGVDRSPIDGDVYNTGSERLSPRTSTCHSLGHSITKWQFIIAHVLCRLAAVRCRLISRSNFALCLVGVGVAFSSGAVLQ